MTVQYPKDPSMYAGNCGNPYCPCSDPSDPTYFEPKKDISKIPPGLKVGDTYYVPKPVEINWSSKAPTYESIPYDVLTVTMEDVLAGYAAAGTFVQQVAQAYAQAKSQRATQVDLDKLTAEEKAAVADLIEKAVEVLDRDGWVRGVSHGLPQVSTVVTQDKPEAEVIYAKGDVTYYLTDEVPNILFSEIEKKMLMGDTA